MNNYVGGHTEIYNKNIIDNEIKISIVKQDNEEPVIQLYNGVALSIIPQSRICFNMIEREIEHIKKHTEIVKQALKQV